MTREYDKDIPIQVWYRGKSETVSKEDVEGLGVELIDIDHMIDILGDARLMGGWESKLYAITHTDFKVVAYLDADAYPVDNLSRMCDIAENDGFAFWQDTGGCENNVKWRKAMGSERPPNAIKAIQGGQLFINREKCWNEIVVAHWMNQHSDYFYQHMYGDQDTWRVAFTLTGKKYANLGNARLADGVFDCQYGGKSYVVHRCQWKMFHLKDIPTGKTRYAQSRHGSLPKEKEAFGHFVEYINKVDKDPAKSFENVYRKRLWGKGSGRGSTPEEGKPYADIINRMMREHGWFDVVDAGCGEGVFCEWLEFGGYTGVDVWPEMIKRNRRKYPEHSWSSGDIADINNLSSGDVLLVKDVLMHWPNEKIRQFLADAIASKKWDAILCTQDNGQVFDGQDTFLGGWRPLNPEMAPLNEFKPVVVAEYLYKSILLFECQ
jgi:SAM-dependent methyltransferase